MMAALSILTTKFVAVGLSKELAGHYNSAYGFLQMFGILADFGLYAVAVREVSRAASRAHVLGTVILLRVIILFVSLSAGLLLAWIIPAWQGTPLPIGITIASLVPFFTLLAGILRTTFQVHYRMHFVFIAEVLQRVISTGLIAVIILMGMRGSNDLRVYEFFLLAGGVGAAVLFVLSLFFSRRILIARFTWDRDTLLRILKAAAPYGLAFLCTALYRQTDQTLIAWLRPEDFALQNAHYGFVLRMGDMAFLLPTFLLNSVLPILSEKTERGESTVKLLSVTLHTVLILGSISLCFAFFWSRPLIELLTTKAYLATALSPGSDTALTMLSLPFFLNGIITFGFYVLLSRHAWRPLVSTLACGALLSVALNIFLIPRYGFTGAALTSIVIHILLATLLLHQSTRKAKIALSIKQVRQWMSFTILLAAFLLPSASLLDSSLKTALGLGIATLWMGLIAWKTGLLSSWQKQAKMVE
jgi:O-antigen/teichoic acid export membrane protein